MNFFRVSEGKLHWIRTALLLGWVTIILSMFWDPITPHLTNPSAIGSPFRLNPDIYLNIDRCVKIRTDCILEQPFSLGTLLWWAAFVPAAILILLVLGHEFWRRICPLSFVSQLPRALGIQRTRKLIDPISGEIRREPVIIDENSWLGKNHLIVQFGLFILGLWARLVFVNGHRFTLGCFLIATIISAIVVGYLYAGKSWCQYFCPMAPVQMVYTGPRSLLGSKAHLQPRGSVTQSMCRIIGADGVEESACVGCKRSCIDTDAENTYWAELNKPGRKLIQYGYLGMVLAFYWYFYLYAGNWDYYFSGAWAHEETLLDRLLDPGFYISGVAVPIPKIIAPLLLFAVAVTATYSVGIWLEKQYRSYRRRRQQPVSKEQAQHVIFSLFTVVSFWAFFVFGSRPTLNRFPMIVPAINVVIVIVGVLWLLQTINRKRAHYDRERTSIMLRRQLHHFDLPDSWLDGRSIEDLSADEVHLLIKASHGSRIQAYLGVVQELLEQGVIEASDSLHFCRNLRQSLGLSDGDHQDVIRQIPSHLLYHVPAPQPVSTQTATVVFKERQRPTSTTLQTVPYQRK